MAAPRKPLLASITLEGFLSFGYGPDALSEMPLQRLNVVIGPNGSGKSNLIDALSLLRAVPQDLPQPIRKGGGVTDWLFKRGGGAARVEVVFGEGHIAHSGRQDPAVRYRLVFGAEGDRFVLLDERLENAAPAPRARKPYFYFGYENGRPMLNVNGRSRALRREDIDPTQSIVSQRKDPDAYPELTRLGELLGRIRIYRSWQFGPDASVRMACSPDARTDGLSEGLSNLPARLAALRRSPAVKRRLVESVRDLSPSVTDFEVVPEGGTLSLYLTEGELSIPARRLSDGSLRYLCLLAILVDPDPPPLVCIEEPELGLHPDILPKLAALLLDASERTQLVVTTHSDVLIDALHDSPESVVVCEKPGEATQLRRLVAEGLRPWLERYRLGELWTRGEIGGNRW